MEKKDSSMQKEAEGSELRPYEHQPLSSPLFVILHIIFLAICWTLYFYLLYLVFVASLEDIEVIEFIGIFIIVSVILSSAITFFWVRHNLNIFKDKGPRKGAMVAEEKYEKDSDGRKVIANWPMLKQSRDITIVINELNKEYVTK